MSRGQIRILLTGGNGFIGQYVRKALLQQVDAGVVEIIAISSQELRAPQLSALGTSSQLGGETYTGSEHWVHCDLLGAHFEAQLTALLERYQPQYLVHLAWCPSGGQENNSPLHWRFLAASIRLFELFAKHGGQYIVGCGTAHEYSPTLQLRVEDSTPTRPVHLYGQSKLALSQTLEVIAKTYGIKMLWTRLGYVVGDLSSFSPNNLFGGALQDIASKKDFTSRIHPDSAFDITSIAELSDLYARLILGQAEGVVNVSAGECLNVRHYLQELFAQYQVSELLHFAPNPDPVSTLKLDGSKLQAQLQHIAAAGSRDLGIQE